MLPAVEQSVLEHNPLFKALYQDLSARVLGQDGSSKDPNKQLMQAQLDESPRLKPTEAARHSLLLSSLQHVAVHATELSLELREAIQLVSLVLQGQVAPEDREIVDGGVGFFLESISPVSAAISDHLVTITKLLVQIAYPDDYLNSNPQSLIRTLPVTAVSLRGAVSSKTSTLASKRTALADLASAVLATHRQLLETGIRILEQTMHGAVARGVRARAEHLAVVAKGMELKLRIIMQTQAPDEGLLSALEVYTSHLAATTKALLAREKAAKGTLQRYEAAGPGMEDIATRYARVCKEIGAVKGEIERLEGKT